MQNGCRAQTGKIRLNIFLLTAGLLCLLWIWRPPPSLGQTWVKRSLLGTSTREYPIAAYQIGNGPIRLAFIGGIHGGYEWNTTLLAYQAIDD